MKPTTEGSIANFDIVCMSFGKGKERGLKVIQGAQKNSIFNEEMFINVEDGCLKENNTVQSANGNIIKFEEKAFETVKRNRKQKAENGIIFNFEEISARKKGKIVEIATEKKKGKKQQEREA